MSLFSPPEMSKRTIEYLTHEFDYLYTDDYDDEDADGAYPSESILDHYDPDPTRTAVFSNHMLCFQTERWFSTVNETATKLVLRNVDRGIHDWSTFNAMVAEYFPKVKYVFVNQYFGSDDFSNCPNLDVIVIRGSEARLEHLDESDIVYRRVSKVHIWYTCYETNRLTVYKKYNKTIVISENHV